MFSWGQDSERGFNGLSSVTHEPLRRLNVSFHVTDLSVARNVLGFVKSNGNGFIMRTNENREGGRVRGKQKFVRCKEKLEAVSCADDVVMFLSDGGKLFCVDTTRSPFTPRTLETFSNTVVAQVSCGSRHHVALTRDGQVYTWGSDSRGQLGLGKRASGSGSPQLLRSLSSVPVVLVRAGGEQSFVLTVSGGVLGWGRNDCGQLGLGDTEDRNSPTCVQSLNLKKTRDVSCGRNHTAVLTKHGVVFTFGSGRYGQLGHNSLRDELRPRLVAELWGSKVIKISCGRNHTLVLTDVCKVYSFGCGEHGQLGHGEKTQSSVPLLVPLPQDTRSVFAGESCSFASCSPDEDVLGRSDRAGNVPHGGLEAVVDRWTSEWDPKSWKKIQQEIHRTFSSASCLNQSFLDRSGDRHFQTSSQFHGLNLKVARRTFKKLVKKDGVWEEAQAALLHLLPLLDKNPVGVESLRIFILLNELLHVVQKHRRQWSTKLPEAVAAAVTGLSRTSLQVLGDWWSSLSTATMKRFVKVWKQVFTVILSYQPVPRSSGVRNLLLVLQSMYNVNSRGSESRRLPETEFCVMMDPEFLFEDLQLWRLRSQRKFVRVEPLVLCNFPVLMNLEAKKLVFDRNSDLTKAEFQPPLFELVLRELLWDLGLSHPLSEVVELHLSRASLLKDTFEQLAAVPQSHYKKRLVVCFDHCRELDDINLYLKDFFHEVFHEMLSAESGLFMFNDSETLAWFSSTAPEGDQRFYLFGVLCGLALYNQVIVYLPFPLVLFKKLLGVRPSLEDMMEFSPTVGRSLQDVLDYTDHVQDLDMYFSISWDGTEVDLDPGNPGKQVTDQNKKQFVEALVTHAFNTSVETVFKEFSEGFFHVCDGDLVRLFRPKELQEVLVGRDFQDWNKLKQNTCYRGEYHADHPNILMFWEVFDEFTEDQKKSFLWFVTGFERIPVLGWDRVEMTIQVKRVQDLSCDHYYPATHTCSSILELPTYSTREVMRAKLTEALISNRRTNK